MNEPKTILIPDHNIAVVDVPEGASNFGYTEFEGNDYLMFLHESESDCILLPPGYTYELVNTVDAMTEEEANGLVESSVKQIGTKIGRDIDDPVTIVYKNYASYYSQSPLEKFKSALESLHSLLESEKIYRENPLGKEKPEMWTKAIDDWHSAEQRVFRNPLILKIKKV